MCGQLFSIGFLTDHVSVSLASMSLHCVQDWEERLILFSKVIKTSSCLQVHTSRHGWSPEHWAVQFPVKNALRFSICLHLLSYSAQQNDCANWTKTKNSKEIPKLTVVLNKFRYEKKSDVFYLFALQWKESFRLEFFLANGGKYLATRCAI